VLIAGGGEQLTLRAVARLADACNIGGDPDMVRHKLSVLRGHCDDARRDYATIEMTHNNSWLLARDEAAVAAKRERLTARGPLPGFVGTVSEAIDLIGQYQDGGVQLLMNSDYRNDNETHELFASELCPTLREGLRVSLNDRKGRYRLRQASHPRCTPMQIVAYFFRMRPSRGR
jgi:alkanesulfonate monooxygenase SsuD/methylene tetrahydromethanopterin reductase-like flavin-dependent oxidoreductase (luciferase family)